MTENTPSLGKFFARTLLWLPLCFSAWYFSGPYHASIVGQLALGLVNQFAPDIVSDLEQTGFNLVFVTTLRVHPEEGQSAQLLAEVNPLIYTYGLAFFFAMMLASDGKWWKVFGGAVALLPFESWGVAFDFLAQIGIKSGPDISAQVGLSGWHLEAIALGYQLGYLIFPGLIPVVLWAVLCPAWFDLNKRALS